MEAFFRQRFRLLLSPSATQDDKDNIFAILKRNYLEVEEAAFSNDGLEIAVRASRDILKELWSQRCVRTVLDELDEVINHPAYVGSFDTAVPDNVPDLSMKTGLCGGLFPGFPSSPQEWNRYALPKEAVEQYWRDGYLSNIKCLTDDECDILLRDLSALSDPTDHHPGRCLFYEMHQNQSGDSSSVLFHALGQWRITKAFHDLIYHPAITKKVSQLLDDSKEPVSVRFWHDQLFSKPPHHGGCVAWHQDYSYWTRTQPMKHITVHIALEDQTKDNGGLNYIAGSHTWTRNGKPLPLTDSNFGDMESIKKILTAEELKQFVPKPANLKKGEVSLHHPLCVHGSYANNSDYSRKAAVLNYVADGVMSMTEAPLLQGIPVVSKGERLGGQFFPLVFSP